VACVRGISAIVSLKLTKIVVFCVVSESAAQIILRVCLQIVESTFRCSGIVGLLNHLVEGELL
jgi:hypothetical protein